jgi:hypothetical protein
MSSRQPDHRCHIMAHPRSRPGSQPRSSGATNSALKQPWCGLSGIHRRLCRWMSRSTAGRSFAMPSCLRSGRQRCRKAASAVLAAIPLAPLLVNLFAVTLECRPLPTMNTMLPAPRSLALRISLVKGHRHIFYNTDSHRVGMPTGQCSVSLQYP